MELMPLAELCARLEDRQRLFLRRGLARLERLICSATPTDSRNRTHLAKLRKGFAAFREKLTAHLREESEFIFPLIRQLEECATRKAHARRTLQNRAVRLGKQHFEADEAIAELRALVANGRASFPVSARVQALRDGLASFERDLHQQIYEENRFLFPRALAVSRA
ncbi:MAG: hemerythrin domain-containing protein [Verrucomicrobia bacterium]|nr:hemerythrin domain-containing protein [Verrucomicrobiota bacterium]